MIEAVLLASKSDARLAALLDEACEYAQIYLLAKERKKGCEGTGELMTLREEFRDVVQTGEILRGEGLSLRYRTR